MRRTSYRSLMAKLVFGMSQSLDGYVDDAAGTLCMPAPRPALFRHFIDVVAGHAGAIYGRRIYDSSPCAAGSSTRARGEQGR
jgi:hypothetical protein